MVQLDYRDARPIYTQIMDGFREQIVTGVLCQGDRLPSVRELACQLTINPNTIQRAYRELEMEGWIAAVPGKGSFVCGVPSGPQREQLALLENFDKIVDGLIALGTSREELILRIEQGGKNHA
ncbi:MAG: GntR family transcriptional regulator [Oscillospiraceae bacterium]|nr:GntR family transcriptional regulator [Oscillospiraceae bacterium]